MTKYKKIVARSKRPMRKMPTLSVCQQERTIKRHKCKPQTTASKFVKCHCQNVSCSDKLLSYFVLLLTPWSSRHLTETTLFISMLPKEPMQVQLNDLINLLMSMNLKTKTKRDCCPFKKANEENANFVRLLARMHKQDTQTQPEYK
jgi:hypothetical protein